MDFLSLLSIFLFFIGFVSYFNNQKHITLIVIIVLSSGYFILTKPLTLNIGTFSMQYGDLALLLIFSLLPFRKKTTDNHIKNITKALIIFLVFLIVSFLYDYLIYHTTPMQIFRTSRKLGYIAFFFLISSFERKNYIQVIKFIFVITIIHSLFYISQYFTGYSLTPNSDMENELGGLRYSNVPSYIIPVLAISLFSIKNMFFKIFALIIILVTIVLAQSRGAIISVIAVLFLFLLLEKKIQLLNLIFISVIVFFSYNIILNYFPIISERFLHLNDEMNMVDKMDYKKMEDFYQQGSFIFRYGLTYERLLYVLEEPMRIVFGVGFVPDIDLLKPIFVLGTPSPALPTGYEQYNSVDIFFPNIITRYGIVGSILYIYFIAELFVFSFRFRELLYGKILFTYLLSLVFISLINETFYNSQYFLILFILIGLITIDKQQIINDNKLSNIKKQSF
jgi:hypothetical protein